MQRFILPLLFLFSSCLHADQPAASFTSITDENKLTILTPSLKNIRTSKIRLANGLEAYLISDPATDKSAAALSVNVGSWSEPEETPGLAHFLEHMLFLGTSKYPEESEYSHFISAHGGVRNAYTANDHTCYMFSVNNPDFTEALDRFSWFFKEPLFNPSGVDRELHAIDQEYAQNLEKDSVREYYVLKELSRPDHPIHGFSMGNLNSLKGISRETLKRFYEEHYSANLMHLTVISSLPIDQLQKLVVDFFEAIPNRHKEMFKANKSTRSTNPLSDMVYIEPVKNKRELSLVWELPAKFSHQVDKKPDSLVAFFLGHEGDESLLAQLKREELAESISVGAYELGGQENLTFTLSIDLTEKGLEQVNTVIERCFQALAYLRSHEYPKYLFDELQQMQKLGYEYSSRQDVFEAVMTHCRQLLYEELSTYPEKTKVIQVFDPKLLADFIVELSPEHCQIILAAPSSVTGVKTTLEEKWLHVPYELRPVAAEKMTEWSSAAPHEKIAFSPPNLFIPQHLSLLPHSEASLIDQSRIPPHPTLLADSPEGKIYFIQDTRYLVPEVFWLLSIKSPELERGNPHQAALADLFIKGVADALNHYSYNAKMAGLKFELSRGDDSLDIQISGYSEKASLLLKYVLENLKNYSSSSAQFQLYKERVLREYENAQKESPLTQASEMLKSVIYKDFASSKNKLRAIKKISFDEFSNYVSSVLASNYLEAVFYGNMTEQEAHAQWELYRTIIGGTPFLKEKQKKKEVLLLPDKGGPFYIERKINQLGNAVILGVENGPYSFRARAAHQVLGKSLEEPFFATLRTRQQTAYIVYSVAQELERQLYTFFAVQSSSHQPRDLLARFELFIEDYLQEMDKNDRFKAQFEAVRQSSIDTLQQPPKNMEEMTRLLQLLGFSYDGDFDWITKRIEGLQQLTLKEYADYSKHYLGRGNKKRFALLVKGKAVDGNAFDYKPLPTVMALRKLGSFASKEAVIDNPSMSRLEEQENK